MITGDLFPEKLPAPFTRSIYPYPLQLDYPMHEYYPLSQIKVRVSGPLLYTYQN